jgi:very-short-patch-repair endonuclease
VLVALMPYARDLEIAREQGWYRTRVSAAPKPTEFGYLAFYQGKEFGQEAWTIRYWTKIRGSEIVKRRDLLPDEWDHKRADQDYHKISIGELQPVPQPIVSRRQRFIVFISTTLAKFQQAEEINDLFHESPLEDEVWEGFKQERIEAERQWYLEVDRATYCLDFAIFCDHGQVDVECDGDTWHSDPARIPADNARDNALTSSGWAVLRFNTTQITKDLPTCLWRVRETANYYGGVVTAEGERC